MVATQRGYGLGLGNGHGVFEIELNSGRPVAQWIAPFGEEAKPKIEALKGALVDRFGEARAERIAERQRNLIVFPNLVINDNIGLSVRTVYPQGPDKLMDYVWALGTPTKIRCCATSVGQLPDLCRTRRIRHAR
jgi:p-cumate 2,3-dioxygenase alpha subunit